MLNIKLWNLPRVELEQRAREARLTLEKLERLLVSRDAEVHFKLWRLVAFSVYRVHRKAGRLEQTTLLHSYLEAGGTLENAQAMAAHESPRTTKLYHRTADVITLDEVERIVL